MTLTASMASMTSVASSTSTRRPSSGSRQRTRQRTRQRPLLLSLLAALLFAAVPSRAAEDPATPHEQAADSAHATAEDASHGAVDGEHGGEHGEAHAGGSPLAEEHGSWFYSLAKSLNNAFFGGQKIISGNHIVSWLIVLLLIGLGLVATAPVRSGQLNPQDEPSPLLNFFEFYYERIEGFFAEGIIGPHGRKFVPLIATFFLFILLNNYAALIPGFLAPTSTLNMTVALALVAFLAVQSIAIRENGFKNYILHFAGQPKDLIGWLLSPLLFVLEFIGELAKPLSLSMRLFGNIFGEDTVLANLILFGLGIFGWQIAHGAIEQYGSWIGAPLGSLIALPMMLFIIFGGALQAFVFTMLVCIYISLLTHHEDHEEHGEHDGHGHQAHGH